MCAYLSVCLSPVAPSVPREVKVTQSEQLPGAVVITWEPPLHMEEPIIGRLGGGVLDVCVCGCARASIVIFK